MGVATGRDVYAEELLQIPRSKLRIAMPAICVMEAWSWFEGEQKRRKAIEHDLPVQIKELRRNIVSPHAQELVAALERARIANSQLLEDIELRLRDILRQMANPGRRGRVDLMALPASLLWASVTFVGALDDPTDQLIGTVIAHHARNHRDDVRILLSSDRNHFGNELARQLLARAGIQHYFDRTDAFLGWFNSLPPSTPAP